MWNASTLRFISWPNLKCLALFARKMWSRPKNVEIVHVNLTTPTWEIARHHKANTLRDQLIHVIWISSFSRYRDFNGPHPFQGWLLVNRLGLVTISLQTVFKVSYYTHDADTKHAAKCTHWSNLRGHVRSSAMLLINRAHTTSYLSSNCAFMLYPFRDRASYLS